MSVFFPARGELLGGVYNPYLWIPIGLATYTGYKLTSWYSYYKALPDDASIESWPWYKKVAVGWMAKGEGFVDAIGAAFNNWKKEQEEKAKLFNKLDSLGKLKFSLTEAFNTAIAPIKAAADFVVGTYNYFKREWERDKWDFAWKLAGIVAGVVATIAGIAAAPVTGGGSLILTAAGITMIASGIAVGAKESYEYTEAKTKKELDRDAKDDLDEIVFVPSTILGGTATTEIGLTSRVIQVQEDEEIIKEVNAPAAIIKGKITPTGEVHYTYERILPDGTRVLEERFPIPKKTTWYSIEKSIARITKKERDVVLYIEDPEYGLPTLSGTVYPMKEYWRRVGVEAHEAYGEAAIERGIVRPPGQLDMDDPAYGALRDISADLGASRIVGRDSILNSMDPYSYNWWNPPKNGYSISGIGTRTISTAEINEYLEGTRIPLWYSSITPGATSSVPLATNTILNRSYPR